MAEVVEISKIRVYQDEGKNRRAYISDFEEPFYYGVHGGVKDFYKTETDVEHPSTLDHIVSAAAG